MSASSLAFALFIYIQLLPLLFLFHICDNSPTDGFIPLATPDVAFNTPLIVVSAASDDQLTTHILDDLTIPEAEITLLESGCFGKGYRLRIERRHVYRLYSPDKTCVIDSTEPSDSVTSLDTAEQLISGERTILVKARYLCRRCITLRNKNLT